VTNGGRGARLPPWQAKYKKWALLLVCILVFDNFMILVFFLFFGFFQKFSGVFSGDLWC